MKDNNYYNGVGFEKIYYTRIKLGVEPYEHKSIRLPGGVMYSLETKSASATAEQRSEEWMPTHGSDREADGVQFAYRPFGYHDNRVPQLTWASAIEVVDLDKAS